VLSEGNPTSTLIKFTAVFWFGEQYNFTIIRWANGKNTPLSAMMTDAEGVWTESHEEYRDSNSEYT
jgi:hypothetical protein